MTNFYPLGDGFSHPGRRPDSTLAFLPEGADEMGRGTPLPLGRAERTSMKARPLARRTSWASHYRASRIEEGATEND